jgi:hypothetical protein
MNQQTATTIRLSRTLGLMLMLMAMLFVSSTQGAFEECSEESVSQVIEVVVGRREVGPIEVSDSGVSSAPRFPIVARNSKSSANLFFVVLTERSRMNGSGTFLLI